jgi:hypothetical protein
VRLCIGLKLQDLRRLPITGQYLSDFTVLCIVTVYNAGLFIPMPVGGFSSVKHLLPDPYCCRYLRVRKPIFTPQFLSFEKIGRV